MNSFTAARIGMVLGRIYDGVIYYNTVQYSDELWRQQMEERFPNATWNLVDQKITASSHAIDGAP